MQAHAAPRASAFEHVASGVSAWLRRRQIRTHRPTGTRERLPTLGRWARPLGNLASGTELDALLLAVVP